MKKILLVIILMFLFVSKTSAEGDISKPLTPTTSKLDDVVLIDLLKPITPTEATFEDDTIDITKLRPITPTEANFEE